MVSDTLLNDPGLQSVASDLRGAYSNAPIAPVRETAGIDGAEAAYAVQEINTAFWTEQGRRISGRKIGLTSPAVQAQLGVDQPDFGALFADMEISEAEEIRQDRVQQPKIEAEIAFVLERDLDLEQPSLADVISATAYALPAFEIVSSRIRDWDIRFVDTVADNASAGVFVLGGHPRKLDTLDLYSCRMETRCGETVVSTGEGRACLGNPLNAARWLAATLARMGTPLKAGDVILSGALGPMAPVAVGDHFVATIEGLGEVHARFASDIK